MVACSTSKERLCVWWRKSTRNRPPKGRRRSYGAATDRARSVVVWTNQISLFLSPLSNSPLCHRFPFWKLDRILNQPHPISLRSFSPGTKCFLWGASPWPSASQCSQKAVGYLAHLLSGLCFLIAYTTKSRPLRPKPEVWHVLDMFKPTHLCLDWLWVKDIMKWKRNIQSPNHSREACKQILTMKFNTSLTRPWRIFYWSLQPWQLYSLWHAVIASLFVVLKWVHTLPLYLGEAGARRPRATTIYWLSNTSRL